MDHAAIIALLGGPTPVAAALGCHRTRVSRWRLVGIPPARFQALAKYAARRGYPEITMEALFAGRTAMLRRQARAARVAA
jgi:hypothetical protein